MAHELVFIENEKISEWWPKILPWAEEFCQHSQESYDPDYILERLRHSLMQLWLVIKEGNIEAVCLTEIRRTRIKEFIIVVMTGNNMKEWLHLLEPLEKQAKLAGCKKMVGVAREGWVKILKPLGYEKRHVQVEKWL